MIKDARLYLIYALFFLAAATAVPLLAPERPAPPLAVAGSLFMYIFVLAPSLIAEVNEERFGGYAFMLSLPLRLETVVRAKFVLPAFLALIAVLYHLVIFSMLESAPEVFRLCAGILVLNGSVAVVLSGVSLLLVFRTGARNVMTGLVLLGVFVNLAFLFAARTGYLRETAARAMSAVEAISPPVLVASAAAAAALHLLLMRAAVGIKRERIF